MKKVWSVNLDNFTPSDMLPVNFRKMSFFKGVDDD